MCFYLNKQKIFEGKYINGSRDGLWLYWHENGSKWMEKIFKDGNIIKESCFDENGNDSDCSYIEP